jgi:nucleoside-diphosphate-sugar epimerase
MRVIVVGGTGNISTGIVKALLEFGHEVTVFTRGQRQSQLPDGVSFIHGDRQDRAAFEAAMQAGAFDAAIDMISFDREDAESAIRAFRGIRHYIHCSTVCTYGGPLSELPATESCELRPIKDYGRGKVAADDLLLQAHADGLMPVTIMKPAHTFGPSWSVLRQLGSDGAWLDRVRKGKPIIVSGDGTNLWSVCSSDDAGLGFAGAVGRETCFGQIYNITHPEFMTWDEYHTRAAAAIGCSIEIVHVPAEVLLDVVPDHCGLLESQTQWHQYYDVGKLMRDVPEFRPQRSFEEAVLACCEAEAERGISENSDDSTWEDEIIAAQRDMACKLKSRRKK